MTYQAATVPDPINDLFEEATAAHRQGRLDTADSLYRAVLETAR